MADLAPTLLRTVTRAFYPTEQVLAVEALLLHSTLPDTDLAHLLSVQVKAVRKTLGRLKEDGIVSTETRQERRTDGGGSFFPGGSNNGTTQQGKERLANKEWYYLNYHRAIDSIKYRLHKLNAHFAALGLPATEKKDLSCPQCKSQWTELDVMHLISFTSPSGFNCARCGHALDVVDEEDRVQENESVKRLNSQIAPILALMQKIDNSAVPENDFAAALTKYRPIARTEVNPAGRTETVDIPKGGLASSKGLNIEPEKIAVSLQSEEEVKKAAELAEKERREKEGKQNALPKWIAESTVSGDVTALGAAEAARRREREMNGGVAVKDEEVGEKKAATGNVDLDAYFAELAKEEAAQKAKDDAEAAEEDEEEDDEDDDEDGGFADVDFSAVAAVAPIPSSAPTTTNGAANVNGKRPAAAPSGVSTPALTSSNATDDERDAKRPRLDAPVNGAVNGVGNAVAAPVAEGTPAASDEDEDEEELDFADV